jgi:alpha-mannosidase
MGDSATHLPHGDRTINLAIERLRKLTQRDRQTDWRMSFEDADASVQCDPRQWSTWQPVTLNDRQHIAWPAGRQVVWARASD